MSHPDPLGNYSSRVKDGILHINAFELMWNNPRWFDIVDPLTINAESGGEFCLLAQLAGSYEAGLKRYDITDPVALGFCEDREYPDVHTRYEHLTKASSHAVKRLHEGLLPRNL